MRRQRGVSSSWWMCNMTLQGRCMMQHGQFQGPGIIIGSVSKRRSEHPPGGASAHYRTAGSQHTLCSCTLLGRAQLMQTLQGLCPTAKSLAEFYKDLFVLGPLPIHGKPQNLSCHRVQLSWATWYYWLSRVASQLSQDIFPILLSPANNLYFVRACLLSSIRDEGIFFSNNTLNSRWENKVIPNGG